METDRDRPTRTEPWLTEAVTDALLKLIDYERLVGVDQSCSALIMKPGGNMATRLLEPRSDLIASTFGELVFEQGSFIAFERQLIDWLAASPLPAGCYRLVYEPVEGLDDRATGKQVETAYVEHLVEKQWLIREALDQFAVTVVEMAVKRGTIKLVPRGTDQNDLGGK